MPRGRTYARNGSILDLQIEPGKISALVSGSSLYKIKISIDPLDKNKWKAIRTDCARQVSSLLDLMRGKLPEVVLTRLTDPRQGMFPSPKELKLQCSCPDYATMCKHLAATLYGVGHLLDTNPALFFKMREVDQSELISDAMATQTNDDAIGLNRQSDLDGEDLSAIFGIDLATTQDALTPLKTGKPTLGTRKRTAATTANAKSKPNKNSSTILSKASTVNRAKRATKSPAAVSKTTSTSTKAAQAKTENAAQKSLGKKIASKKAPSKKAPSKKAPSKKAPIKKVPSKKTPSKKASSKKSLSKHVSSPFH